MVLKRMANTNTVGKLESKWDRPYIITRMTRAGLYHLTTVDRDPVSHTWNAKSLRKFYP